MQTLTIRNVVKRSVGRFLTSSLARAKTTVDPVQEAALNERCYLVDKNDKVIGTATKKECHTVDKNGNIPLHRAFSVFLFDNKGDLLLQKRSEAKMIHPNHYTSSCTGHPLADIPNEANETDAWGVRLAAQRRLFAELGIGKKDVPIEKIHFITRVYHRDVGNGEWGDHEINYILLIQAQVKFKGNPAEVSEISLIPRDGFDEYMATLNAPLSPRFKFMAKHRLLHLWWSHLKDWETLKNDKILVLDK